MRYEDCTVNLGLDWCSRRQRDLGLAFPVGYPVAVVGHPGSDAPILPEAGQLPVDPISDAPHGFDESQRNQPICFAGEPDVFDTWFTSSLTPQLAARYGEPDDRMAKLFPM